MSDEQREYIREGLREMYEMGVRHGVEQAELKEFIAKSTKPIEENTND